jgi:DNA-binding response OmpR family regulator
MAIKILVVEDELVIAENLRVLLKSQGYDAAYARDGAEGVARARQMQPQLVLLDVMLPKLSGLEVCRALKKDPATKNIHIVMVTGLGRSADVDAAFAAGACDYIIKPFETKRLLKKIEKVLGTGGTTPA